MTLVTLLHKVVDTFIEINRLGDLVCLLHLQVDFLMESLLYVNIN